MNGKIHSQELNSALINANYLMTPYGKVCSEIIKRKTKCRLEMKLQNAPKCILYLNLMAEFMDCTCQTGFLA
jgi:hypothetical protein